MSLAISSYFVFNVQVCENTSRKPGTGMKFEEMKTVFFLGGGQVSLYPKTCSNHEDVLTSLLFSRIALALRRVLKRLLLGTEVNRLIQVQPHRNRKFPPHLLGQGGQNHVLTIPKR